MPKLSEKTAITPTIVDANKGSLHLHLYKEGSPNVSYNSTDNDIMTQVFADAAARAAAVPGFIGQIGIQIDEVANGGGIYISDGITAGDWVAKEGEWTDVAFNAADFVTGDDGSWTVGAGDVTYFRYKISGKTMSIYCHLVTTTITSTPPPPSSLRVTIPASKTVRGTSYGVGYTGGGTIPLRVGAYNGNSYIELAEEDLSPFTAGVNNQEIIFNISFEIN